MVETVFEEREIAGTAPAEIKCYNISVRIGGLVVLYIDFMLLCDYYCDCFTFHASIAYY